MNTLARSMQYKEKSLSEVTAFFVWGFVSTFLLKLKTGESFTNEMSGIVNKPVKWLKLSLL